MNLVSVLRTILVQIKGVPVENSWTPRFMETNKGVILWLFELGKAKEQ